MNTHNSILGWARTCYGVDLQADTPVIVRAELAHGKVECAPVTPDGQSFLDDQKKGIPMIACLTARESFLRTVQAPFPSFAKAEKVLPSLLDIDLPFSFEDCVYDIAEMKKGDAEVEMTVAAARRKDVERRLSLLKGMRIDPQLLDHEGLALWTQSLRESPVTTKLEKAPRAIIYLGKERATLSLGKGETLLSAHAIDPDNPPQIARLLNRHFGPLDQTQDNGLHTTDDSLEPSDNTPSLFSGLPPKADQPAAGSPHPSINWFWAGPGARAVNPLSSLRSELNTTWPGPSVVHDKPETFLARALATRALSSGPLRCNLRSGNMTHESVTRQETGLQQRLATVLLAAGLLLCAANWTADLIADKKMSRLDNTFTTIRDGLMGHHLDAKGRDAIAKVHEKITQKQASLQQFVTPFRESILTVLEAIQKQGIEHDLRFDKLFIGNDRVFINGTSPDWNSSDQLVSCLQSEGYRVINRKKDALADERIPFTIESEETP